MSHVVDDLDDETSEVAEVLEDSEEIQKLQPHEEHSYRLKCSFIFFANIQLHGLDADDEHDDTGVHYIYDIPYWSEIRNSIISHLC